MGIGPIDIQSEKCEILLATTQLPKRNAKRDRTHLVNGDGSELLRAKSGRKARVGIEKEGTITRKR